MLAQSLDAMKQEIVDRFDAGFASGPGSGSGATESLLRSRLPALLDDLGAALRGGHVDAARFRDEESSALPSGHPGCGAGPERGRLEALAREHALLRDCIHDVIEQRGVGASVRETRVLVDWLSARACASALAFAGRLEEQNRRFAALLDAVPDPMSAVCGEGRVCYLNRASLEVAHAVSDVPFDEIAGRRWQDLGYPSPSARGCGRDLATARAGSTITTEVLYPTPRGARWFEQKVSPIRREDGTVASFAVVSRDIHDRKLAQEEASQALAFREQVMGILGHDLRNPLGAVQALTSLLLRGDALAERARASLVEIDRAAKRMQELIGTLLDFSESRFKGSLPIAPAPTDLRELCRGVIDELQATHPGRRIELVVEGDGRGAWDPSRLAQVVSNLVGNALEHGDHAPVQVSVWGCEEEVVLRVRNRGPAIAPELLSVLFEPFRGRSVSRRPSRRRGLGLGLYIVRQIVIAHGGDITVRSAPEQGTTFTVRLPRTRGMTAGQAKRAGREDGAAAGA